MRAELVLPSITALPRNGLVAHWPCTDASGQLTDLLGVYTGTLGAATAAPTLNGTSITFDGSNDVITTLATVGTQGTMIVACNPPSLPAGTKAIMGVMNGASGFGYLGILANGKARIALNTTTLDSNATAYVAGSYTIHGGGWDTSVQEVYVHGLFDKSVAVGGAPHTVGIYLGCANSNGTANLFVNADIAYALVYSRRLFPAEHRAAYRYVKAQLAGRGLATL